jgi:hypothetical protein
MGDGFAALAGDSSELLNSGIQEFRSDEGEQSEAPVYSALLPHSAFRTPH